MIQNVIVQVAPQVPVSVTGQDIDAGLIRSLTVGDGRHAGDKVLVEINGKRVYSSQACPLVAELPWEVVANDDDGLQLRHPSSEHVLTLRWDEMLKGPLSEPAVFVISDKWFSCHQLYVILQFVAYSTTSTVAHDSFKPEWDMDGFEDMLQDGIIRRATLDRIQKELSALKHPGWGWKTLHRFALRAGVRPKIVEAFRTKDTFTINSSSDETIIRLIRELRWLKAYRSQNELVQVSNETFAG